METLHTDIVYKVGKSDVFGLLILSITKIFKVDIRKHNFFWKTDFFGIRKTVLKWFAFSSLLTICEEVKETAQNVLLYEYWKKGQYWASILVSLTNGGVVSSVMLFCRPWLDPVVCQTSPGLQPVWPLTPLTSPRRFSHLAAAKLEVFSFFLDHLLHPWWCSKRVPVDQQQCVKHFTPACSKSLQPCSDAANPPPPKKNKTLFYMPESVSATPLHVLLISM